MSYLIEAAIGVAGLLLIDHFAHSAFDAMCLGYFFGSTLAVTFFRGRTEA